MERVIRVIGIVSSLFVLLSGLAIVGAALFSAALSSGSVRLDQLSTGIVCGLWFAVAPLMLVFQGAIGLLRASRSDNP